MAKLSNIAKELSSAYRVDAGSRFRLRNVDPGDTGSLDDSERAKEILERSVARLSELQEKLYAQDRWSVLLIFQAMDAAGKDSAIKHVLSGVNPQGCQVASFKQPSFEELEHDFLWRCMKKLPERGRIGVFNRSYYEEVLAVRVHQEYLQAERLPAPLLTKGIWRQRYEDISAVERYLARQGVVILKFFLHVSKAEQRKRFLARLQEPSKNWKFAMGDVEERKHWKQYMVAYEDMIRGTSAQHAPWYVIPADRKWYTRLVVASAVINALEGLDLQFPKLDQTKKKELEKARQALERGG